MNTLNYNYKFFLLNDEIKKSEQFNSEEVTTGRSLYEVIRIIDGKPLFLEKHLNRLENSSRVAGLKLWIPRNNIKDGILKLIDINKCRTGNIKLVFNYNLKNNFLIYFIEYHYPDDFEYKVGVDTILFFGERKNPNAKIIDLDFRKQIDVRIKKEGVFEALLVDRNGNITEGSRSNVFFVKGRKLFTAPVEQVLPGTTRQVIMEICHNIDIDIEEKKVNYKNIDEFDAAFISGTSPKVLPIKSIGNLKFSSSDNEIVLELMRAYDKCIYENIKNFNL